MRDPFRTVPIRHLGHGFAIGEAFAYNFSYDVVDVCNTIATGYILIHAIHQGLKAETGGTAIIAAFDTLIFDGLASAVIPAFLTYHICRITVAFLGEFSNMPPVIIKWGPMIVGLASIVFSWEHIDKLVNELMDQTIRTLY